MKRNLSLLLLISMLASLAACGGTDAPVSGDTTAADTTEPVVETDYLETIVTDKYNGKTLRIFDANDHPEMHINVALDEQNGDLVNDALFDRDRLMEETFGITVEYTESPGTAKAKDACRQLDQAVLAGDDSWDFVISCLLGGALTTSATSGTLYNLLDVDSLHLNESHWSSLLYDSFRLNDIMYFSTGDISPAMYQGVWVTFANTRLMDEYKIDADALMQQVLDGKWTLDALFSLTKDLFEDKNDDGVMHIEEDFFGYSFHTNNKHVLDSAAVRTVILNDKKDGFELNFNDEHNVSVVEKLKTNYISWTNTSNANEGPKQAFKNARTIFYTHPIEVAMSHLRDMKDDYIILPIPKANEAQESYISTYSGWISSYTSIPLTADAEFAGTMMEAMAYIGRRDIRPKAYDLAYKQKAVRDERSAQILDLCFDSAYIDFNSIFDFGGSYTITANASVGNGELISGLAGVKSATETAIADFVKSWNQE